MREVRIMRSIKDTAKELGLTGARRRAVIKYALLGVGAFVAGKILGPRLSLFSSDLNSKEYSFRNFRVVENGDELGFYDKLGNEILILEKDPTAGE